MKGSTFPKFVYMPKYSEFSKIQIKNTMFHPAFYYQWESAGLFSSNAVWRKTQT